MKPHSWIHPSLEVRESKINGKGVFTTSSISKKERLAIFGGDIMMIDELDNLSESLQDYPMQIEERFVMGSREQRAPEIADYFNHSCDPNSGFRGQIFLVALRDIKKDEEITFDYAMVVSESHGSSLVFEMDCECGSPACRKKISEDDWKNPCLRGKYNGFFSQYIQEMIDAEQHSRKGSGITVDDYSSYCEGDIEQTLQKKIDTLIDCDNDYIVYLDDEYYVEWSWTETYGELPSGFAAIANRLRELEALSRTSLRKSQIRAFAGLLAESMARILGDGDEKEARQALVMAESYLHSRSVENARSWYLLGALAAATPSLLAVIILWLIKSHVVAFSGITIFRIIIGSLLGGAGALLSVLTRTKDIPVAPTAGPSIHYIESAARVLTGHLGALIIALAMTANILLGFTQTKDYSFAVMLLICTCAGASERLVSGFITRVESSINLAGEKKE
jgi:hypothetical protein